MEHKFTFEITYWKAEPADSFGLLSVPGLMITGWWPRQAPPIEVVDEIHRIWHGVARSIELGQGAVEEPDGLNHQIVAFVRFDDDIEMAPLDILEASLRLLVDRGAAIAWAGGHECEREFSERSGGERCFAAFTEATGFLCAADSGKEYLVRQDIQWLRRAVREYQIRESP